MKRTMLISVTAIALAAGSTVALSQGSGSGSSGGGAAGQGAGGNTPTANQPSSGGQDTTLPTTRGTKGAQDQKSTQSPSISGKQGASDQKSTDTKQGASDQKSTGTQTGQQGTATRSGSSNSVSLTSEQKTTIRNTVLASGPKVTNVNFDVRVGTVVPRTVRIAPLPATIVEIQPAWRGYMYFIYSDEIVVVEPGTLRIVAVLDV